MSWRAKLGVIYPADGALDHEYWELVPSGVSVHYAYQCSSRRANPGVIGDSIRNRGY